MCRMRERARRLSRHYFSAVAQRVGTRSRVLASRALLALCVVALLLAATPLLLAAAPVLSAAMLRRGGARLLHAAAAAAAASGVDCTSSAPHVLVFTRVNKVGSTTLARGIIKSLAARNGFNFTALDKLGEGVTSAQLDAAIAAALASPRRSLIVAHASFGGASPAVRDGRVAYFSMVREPVARCVSAYHQILRKSNPALRNMSQLVSSMASMEACLAADDAAAPQACAAVTLCTMTQTSFFCSADSCALPRPGASPFAQYPLEAWRDRDSLVTNATRNAASHYRVVGLTERYVDSLDALEQAYPTFFAHARATYEARNVTYLNAARPAAPISGATSLSAAVRDALQGTLAHERRFYSGAAARFEKRHAACVQGARTRLEGLVVAEGSVFRDLSRQTTWT